MNVDKAHYKGWYFRRTDMRKIDGSQRFIWFATNYTKTVKAKSRTYDDFDMTDLVSIVSAEFNLRNE